MNNFNAITTIAKTLNRMPLDYRSLGGRIYPTYYTTVELLSKIVNKLDDDDTLDKDIRNLENSCLKKEFGFKSMCIFFNRHNGEAIAILGI